MNAKNEINDTVVRLIGIPFFGFLIPNATGLVDNIALNFWELIFTYLWFVFGAGIIWQGNRYFLFKFIEKGDWLTAPARRLAYIFGSSVLYTFPVATILLALWYWWLVSTVIAWVGIGITVIIIFVCVVFVTSAYELIYQVKLKENQRVKAEQLENAKILAELEALKSHIDPHFMFNSLNLISYLIDDHPDRASKFVDDLSEVYRYILQSKTKDLVLLGDEMDFTAKYIALLEIRFENSLSIDVNIDSSQINKFLVPPVSIMMAVENAVKHNEASQLNKLTISITQRNKTLTILNNLSIKKNVRHSSKTGLHNLAERFRRISGAEIIIQQTDEHFTLTLPLLPITAS